MNCIDVILFQAELTPDRLALVAHGTILPYGRLALGIVSAQNRLAAAGLREGNTVGLFVSHPIDHFVFACALYRMKVASATITNATETYLDNVTFDAVLADRVNPLISQKQPHAKIFLVDTTWFQDKVAFDVAQRTHASGDNDNGWVCRINCYPAEARMPTVVTTTAASLEQQVIGYNLSAPPDWERMISIMYLGSNSGFMLGLSAASQGRSICFADVATVRNLIVGYKHHYLVASTQEIVPLLARQKLNHIEMPALRGVYIEGSSFSNSMVIDCLTTMSANIVLSYSHPQLGVIAYGPAHRVKDVDNAVGFVVPWVELEIVDGNRMPVASGNQGKLRFRRRADSHATSTPVAHAAEGDWIYPGQTARLLKDNMLIVGRADETVN